MIPKTIIQPIDPRLDPVAEAHALTGLRLLRELGVDVTVVLPFGRIDITGPAEARCRADAVVALWQRPIVRLAIWTASALDDATLVVGTSIYRGDDADEPLFSVRRGTLEELAGTFAQQLRSSRGLSLRRRDANAIADAIDGLTGTLRAERAARRP